MLALAAALADDARTYVRPHLRRKIALADKPDGTPVTDVDKGIETLLRRRIRVRAAARIQHWGADCHSYGLLASGFIDLVVESSPLLHDFCALVPMVEGAGGIMTDWAGRPLGPGSAPRVIAAGHQTHREALALLAAQRAW